MVDRPAYMDCAASTPIDPRVFDLVCHIMKDEFGNAGSRTHIWGAEAKKLMERARAQVAAVVEASPDEVIFTSGATEANNLAILGLTEYGLADGKRHIVSTQIEHKAILEPLQEMSRRGFEVTLIPPTPDGWVNPEDIAASLRPDTLLVSVMHVNNETGIIQPLEEICEVLKDHPAYFHTDSAQGFGKELKQSKSQRIDLLSASAHKLFGPKGVGALVMRRRRFKRPPIRSLTFGGGQEFGVRPGTAPVALNCGFGRAAELSLQEGHARALSNLSIRETILKFLEAEGFSSIGDQSRVLPNILCVSHLSFDSEFLRLALKDIVSISNGAACSSTQYSHSHVLQAMHLPPQQIETTTRWSWFHQTKLPSLSRLAEALARK